MGTTPFNPARLDSNYSRRRHLKWFDAIPGRLGLGQRTVERRRMVFQNVEAPIPHRTVDNPGRPKVVVSREIGDTGRIGAVVG